MAKQLVTILGKAVQRVARLRGGGGSAMPGLVVEKIDPNFVSHALKQFPLGVAVISGTNGKTTTTKMVVELLEGQGLKVFTNRTGSNFTRGIAAALLNDMDKYGQIKADIAVLELDEAHAVHFVKKIAPTYTLLLNVMRDQLDRFGEINYTAKLLAQVAQATTKSVVLNREDPLIAKISEKLSDKDVRYFGLSDKLVSTFPSDDSLHTHSAKANSQVDADVVLESFSENNATFNINGEGLSTSLKLNGVYNVYNAAAALAFVRTIMNGKIDDNKLSKSLANVEPAFGRGETIVIKGHPLELVLVKNPSGFQLGLESFSPDGFATMIAINDNYADGRDMSWLWDVDFHLLAKHGVDCVSGIRAYDMALRLQYDEAAVKKVSTDLIKSLRLFVNEYADKPKRVFCTYTAMLSLRRELNKLTKVKVIR